MLLHLSGEGVYDIYDGLIVPDVPADADPAENNFYIAARKALDDHFSPKKNADFEIYNFRLAKQLQHDGHLPRQAAIIGEILPVYRHSLTRRSSLTSSRSASQFDFVDAHCQSRH